MKMKKRRLDEILIETGKAGDRHEAFIMVTEGRVTVAGQKAVTPAQMMSSEVVVEVRDEQRYVGRGAHKLAAALDSFPVHVSGIVCADVGAATGGFTQVLLERGAVRVYAIDTAIGKLALKVRQEARVVVMEGTDVRHLDALPESIDLAVIDISLLPLRDILPSVRRLLGAQGSAVALFKPQYETRDPSLLRHGIIRDDATREALLNDFAEWAAGHGWRIAGQIVSPIRGGEGNTEYLFHLFPTE